MSNGPESKSWEVALGIAGAAAGLAAFAYLVGAVIIWLRLYIAGFPADIGLELVSDGRVIGVGVRGIGLVGLIVAFLLVVTHQYGTRWAQPIRGFVERHRLLWVVALAVSVGVVLLVSGLVSLRILGMSLSLLLVATAAVGLDLARTGVAKTWEWLLAVGAGLAAIVVSSVHGWRLFGLVVALLGVAALVVRPSQLAAVGKGVPWWVNLGVVGCVAVAGIAWQVNSPIKIASVVVSPPTNPNLPGEPVPFFGTTDDYIYVAEIERVTNPGPDQPYPYRYMHRILELPREDLTSVEFTPTWLFAPRIKPPSRFAWDWLKGVWGEITGHAEPAPDHAPDVASLARFSKV